MNTEHTTNTRRSFLKKTMYAAPTIFALGALSAPAHANGSGGLVSGTVKKEDGTTGTLQFKPGTSMGNFFKPKPK